MKNKTNRCIYKYVNLLCQNSITSYMFWLAIVAFLKLATIAGQNTYEATLFTIKKFTYFYMHIGFVSHNKWNSYTYTFLSIQLTPGIFLFQNKRIVLDGHITYITKQNIVLVPSNLFRFQNPSCNTSI